MRIQNSKILLGKVLALFFLGAGAALRFWQIKKYDLWFDELATGQFSFAAVEIPSRLLGVSKASILWERIASAPDSQLYNFLVYIYSFFFGGWESIRYFSCIASIAAMFIFYKICRRYLKLSPQELAGVMLLMAISPFQIWYAQEARTYAFSSFLTLVWFLCFLFALHKNRIFPWLLFIILSILYLLTTYYAGFLIILSGLFIFGKNYPTMEKRARAFFLIAIMLFPAILILLLKKFCILQQYFWLPPPEAKSIPLTFSVLIQGYSATQIQRIIGEFLFTGLFIFGCFKYYKQRKLQEFLYPCLFLIPIIIIFVISKTFLPLYLDRRFIIFTPFYYLCLVKGACSIKNKVAKIIIAVVVLALLGYSLPGYYNGFMELRKDGGDVYRGVHRKTQYRKSLSAIINELDKEDIVCADGLNSLIIAHRYFKWFKPDYDSAPVVLIYYPRLLPYWEKRYLRLSPVEESQIPGKTGEPLLLSFSKWENRIQTSDALNKYKNILFISAPWNQTSFLSGNARAISKFLAHRCKITSVRKIDALSIEAFECKSDKKE